jgi:Zn-dependent protease with chaperone function
MNDATPVIEARRLETPTREQLFAKYEKVEAFSKAILAAECIVALLTLVWIVWKKGDAFTSWMPWAAFTLGGLGVFRWFLHHIFLNKKRLEDIRLDAKFGDHNRDSLLRLAEDVFARLGLNRKAAPVFLTRAKDVNAQAVRCELWPGLHLFNGVFLNRSIIHLLDERELATVIGHELGHVFPYSPLLSRCYIVHSLFAGITAFAVAAAFPHVGVVFMAPLVILWVLDRLIIYPHMCLSRGIEFLCDDYGAQAAGLLPALSSEFKIAAEQETREQLLTRLLQARKDGAKCGLQDLVEAYDEAIPFGKADPAMFEKEFQKATAQRANSKTGVSIGGFLEHLQGDGSDGDSEVLNEELKKLELLNKLPVIDLDRSAYLQGSNRWSTLGAERLANAITTHPDKLLVRSLTEIDDRASTHPNASRRILFLWRNRSAYPVS